MWLMDTHDSKDNAARTTKQEEAYLDSISHRRKNLGHPNHLAVSLGLLGFSLRGLCAGHATEGTFVSSPSFYMLVKNFTGYLSRGRETSTVAIWVARRLKTLVFFVFTF